MHYIYSTPDVSQTLGQVGAKIVMPNLCTNSYQVVSSFWAEAKGIHKLCELQESLFVCLFVSPPLFLLPTRRCSEEIGFYDYHGMVLNLGGGYSYLGKYGLLEKVFLFPKVAAKFKDLHVCLRLPLKGFCVVHLLCSNWQTGKAHLLDPVELVSGWNLLSLGLGGE